jgi:hypothetical protein
MAITRHELLKTLAPELNAAFQKEYLGGRYGGVFKTTYMEKAKVDAHKYETEAKDLPIEVCRNMWVVRYGNEPVSMEEINNQDKLVWEIGNRLYWAELLDHDPQMDEYSCK